MSTRLILLILGFTLSNLSFGQKQDSYKELIDEAYTLFQNEEFLQSGIKYNEAFYSWGNRGMINDRYNAACAWTLANKADSAFIQLFKIAKSGHYIDYEHIINDKDLEALHSDQRWTDLLEIIKSNEDKVEAKYNKPLKAILDSVYIKDQKCREHIYEMINKYGYNSKEVETQNQMIIKTDSINLIRVKEILDKYGWLGSDVVGNQGNLALFLVIQHSDLKTQEKYLPLMREAVKKGNAIPNNLALLEDRVLIGQGKRQKYGSQIGQDSETGKYYILPLDDPDNVDKRRQEVGLEKLQDYVSQWDIKWNVEEYKKQLPEIEAKQKK